MTILLDEALRLTTSALRFLAASSKEERVRVLEVNVSGLVAIAEGEFELIKELKDAVAAMLEERERERGEL